ncbi:MAG: PD-(D/E)XK nuclease family transposase [Planctomycetaceae bacterium]|nr:PD-(D/E)XK nuclease family transposase [Planctomycetaceae bacterium]
MSIFDILARDRLGKRFNIDVQRTFQDWLPERLSYDAATQLVEQIGDGDHYQELRPSRGICILKGTLFADSPYHHQFRRRTLGLDVFRFCGSNGNLGDDLENTRAATP